MALGQHICVLTKTGHKKIKPTEEKNLLDGLSGLLIRDFQLHAAVEDIARQSVQADDFLVAAAAAEVLLRDCP